MVPRSESFHKPSGIQEIGKNKTADIEDIEDLQDCANVRKSAKFAFCAFLVQITPF